ncbi:MAG: hypothetical protein KatS3mg105_1123 [Gemmatales bacterium]|nr:MAG: hypothetical protein KatS3mg105_1123 [Gemmatales bacterium]
MTPQTITPPTSLPPHGHEARPRQCPTEPSLFRRIFRLLASLHLAIFLLAWFAWCLAAATFLESAYSAEISRELIYHSWWFAFLLCCLAANVLCAALKKFPWKKHQIGFLVTHAGLLVILFGGLLTTLSGQEGQMVLIDTENRQIHQFYGMSNTSDTLLVDRLHEIQVVRVPSEKKSQINQAIRAVAQGGENEEPGQEVGGETWSVTFSPGSLTWYGDERVKVEYPAMLRCLQKLASPFPGISKKLSDDLSLAVTNYHPYTEYWPFAQATEGGSPALKIRLSTPILPEPVERWVSTSPTFSHDPLPLGLEFMQIGDPKLVREFRQPPPPHEMGAMGQLVLYFPNEEKPVRLPIGKEQFHKPILLPGSLMTIRLTGFGEFSDLAGWTKPAKMSTLPKGDPAQAAQLVKLPSFPTLRFELSGLGGKTEHLVCARLPQLAADRFISGNKNQLPAARVSAWYHYPDFRFGNENLMGSLQILHSPDDSFYYRVFGKDGLMQPGTRLDVHQRNKPIKLPWKRMDMSFEIAACLDRAVRANSFVPKYLRPGTDGSTQGLQPAIRCRLTEGKHSADFWLRLSRKPVHIRLGDNDYLVRYTFMKQKAGFQLQLKEARRTTDPGTDRPATFESDVVLTPTTSAGAEQRIASRIAMNQPLCFGNYKIYQTSYRPLRAPDGQQLLLDANGKLVSLSGLTVAYDPGLYFKYAGSLLLVLGIATMFYMKAYFFRRLSEKKAPASPP